MNEYEIKRMCLALYAITRYRLIVLAVIDDTGEIHNTQLLWLVINCILASPRNPNQG